MGARSVIVGIRPESLTLAPADDSGFNIEAKVEVVELTGPELVVTSTIGSQRLTASLPPKSKVMVGASQRFGIDASALHVFDKATEREFRAFAITISVKVVIDFGSEPELLPLPHHW